MNLTCNKKRIIWVAIAIFAVAVLFVIWNLIASPTRVGFVNYQAITLGQIAKAGAGNFIKVSEISVDELGSADDYDMVFVNGMGLRITDEQRKELVAASERGANILTTAATNPENLVVSVDSVDAEFLKQYLAGGGRTNYRNMMNYIRKFIDGKRLFVEMPGDPQAMPSGLLYHADMEHEDADECQFNSVSEYEAYLKKCGVYKDGAPAVILTGQMGVPDSLVSRLEATGNNVYCVNSIQRFIRDGHADSISVAAMINMAHGRMGDQVVEYLTEKNIPLFSPLNANRDYNDWMDDKMGMNGGFLSQSVVTPEIDGAVRPFVLFAHFEGKDGLPYVAAIPDRLDEFVTTVNNYISLRSEQNKNKRIAIFYFKGPGQSALVAEGMEVGPSLYNLLLKLRAEGYNVAGLPASAKEFEAMLCKRGSVFSDHAEGDKAEFIKECNPELIDREEYDKWCAKAFSQELRADIDATDGEFPGHGLNDGKGNLAVARLTFGNVVLVPQTAAGIGDDSFKIVHGTDKAPLHAYVGAYLWARFGFEADALIHFGAHGSLEFTPRKQAALGSDDWPDRLVGTMPHFYIYSTSNVGEAMMAKRRSYAGIVNYLTPPFMESEVRGIYRELTDAIAVYNKLLGQEASQAELDKASLKVKSQTLRLGIHRELRMDSIAGKPYSADDIVRIENFAEELTAEKILGPLYVMGVPYDAKDINSTVTAMTVDPIAYSLYALDKENGRTTIDYERQRARFNSVYGAKARSFVGALLSGGREVGGGEVCRIAGITESELAKAHSVDSAINGSRDLLSKMMVMGSSMPVKAPTAKVADRAKSSGMKKMMSAAGMSPEKAIEMAKAMGADEKAIEKMKAAMASKKSGGSKAAAHSGHGGMMMGNAKSYSPEEVKKAMAILEVERALTNVDTYRAALASSPDMELSSVINGLSGGYIAPTSGGDPVLNPNILPTGRNMFAVNAEETPTEQAWEKGKALAENTLKMYREAHGDSLPRKVSYTLWSSEFIETEGATIAQVLYMLGVEPIRDPFSRVTDLRLIPSAELGRPRVDVVVQTSGQLRDLAASRLFLINRAVNMAASADDKEYPNYVKDGVVESERHLVDRGVSPKEARTMSTARVFGGVNGSYGTGIQSMVEAGDRWDDESQIAETYIHNMGATYTSEEDWEKVSDYAFEAALTRTDAVVQPRQSNTWGALSLDHVYEFMGGMNLAVRNVTGKDPEAYLSDYRNRNNARMQEVKEAIGVESRTTILNPTYIKNKMKGGAGDASGFADVIRNTYGWNVMKPDAIDDELWDDIYDTYVDDKYELGTQDYFRNTNPAALQEITAVMLETARKGMWEASEGQIHVLAELHTDLVEEFGASNSVFVSDNAKLRDFISQNVSTEKAAEYNRSIADVRAESVDGGGMVMQKEEMNALNKITNSINGYVVVAIAVVGLLLLALLVVRRRRSRGNNNLFE